MRNLLCLNVGYLLDKNYSKTGRTGGNVNRENPLFNRVRPLSLIGNLLYFALHISLSFSKSQLTKLRLILIPSKKDSPEYNI
jgi:hypothetical protein